jgi:hypothetical protein
MEGLALASNEWYETPARCVIGREFIDTVTSLLPPGWTVHRTEIWLNVSPAEARVPAQGFKIHVSTVPQCARDLLAVVAAECIARGMSFKCAAGPELLSFQNGKGRDRGGGGKFMTLYPPDDAAFADTLEVLYTRMKDRSFVGPYILSDRRYKDSKVLFYRYGGLRGNYRLQPTGNRLGVLVGPNGEEIEDRREAFFVLPSWARDPFESATTEEEEGGTVIGQHFEVTRMIAANNRGGVYDAVDLRSGETVVIKECRPHMTPIGIDGRSIDPHSQLRHEYEVLQRLDGLEWTPRPICLFQDWEHLFLAQQKLPGVMLGATLPQMENQWLPYVRRVRGWETFLPKFARLAGALMEAVEAIHNRGVILGDLSMNNILVDPETWQVRLIDFESAIRIGEDEHLMAMSCGWATPGYTRPGRLRSGVVAHEDDFYALSRVLRGALLPSAGLSELNPDCHVAFMQFLRELGVPRWPFDVVNATAAGDFAAARAALANA